jgi:biopolymer transport protein ExbD
MSRLLLLALQLTILISFSSCNQIAMGIGHAIVNLIMAPFVGIGNVISEVQWGNMQERIIAAKVARAATGFGDGASCVVATPTDLATALAGDLTGVRNNLCTCKVWGTCSKKNCPCDQLCPDTFEMLDRDGDENKISKENTFIFRNRAEDFAGVHTMAGGFCWGIQVLEQRFNRMAFFHPSQPKAFPADRDARIAAYRDVIARIENNQVGNIPGFANLREFSEDPEVRDILLDRSGEMWAHHAMGVQGLRIIASSTPIEDPESKLLIDDLEYRVRNHQTPTIVLNKEGEASYAHVVEVMDVRRDANGHRYLCIKDSNYSGESQTKCESKMEVNTEGNLTYNQWGDHKLGQVEITNHENSDVVAQVNALRNKCEAEKDCD